VLGLKKDSSENTFVVSPLGVGCSLARMLEGNTTIFPCFFLAAAL
jgi:hypothetical protein